MTVSDLVASIDGRSKGRFVVTSIKSLSGHYVATLRLWREHCFESWGKGYRASLEREKLGMIDADMNDFQERKLIYYFYYSMK